jgi:DNA-binding transcriptional LysR family regulator
MNNLRQIALAVALDRHWSFAAAAEAMHVSQPAFSRGIAALESDLGVRLFDRSTRHVQTTPAGVVFLRRAVALLAGAGRLRQALNDYEGLQSGKLSIGVGPYPLEISVLESVARLASRHPSLTITAMSEHTMSQVPTRTAIATT